MSFAAWIRTGGSMGTRAAGAFVVAALVWFACEDDSQTPPDNGDGPPPAGLTDPIWEYPRSQGQSITGGYVYRGPSIPSLVGKYVYADHPARHIWALSYDDTVATNEFLVDAPNRVSSFGVAENGELFVCGYSTGGDTKIRGLSESGGVYTTTDAFPNLTFDRPVDLQNAGDGTDRLFVVEQPGIIRVFQNNSSTATTSEFLDISSDVACCSELGLLGLAFHPDYETNGFFYVYYTTTGGTPYRDRLSRFQVSAGDPNDADESTEKILFEVNDRQGNHNGGALCFDADGYLFVAMGDEGGSGDVYDNAQNRKVLFGKILRLDVDYNVAPYYGIPPSNPFVGNVDGYREEIFAWGFRNPWRMSYDTPTDRLWVGDVGQDKYEEIDIVEIGKNYGWDCREGKHNFLADPSPACP
jgi:Glucose / Sorbosone dehydrogenase